MLLVCVQAGRPHAGEMVKGKARQGFTSRGMAGGML
jgi:hypothetical protein